MRVSQLGAAAALGSLAQAFLLPPTISSADNDVINTLPFEAVAIEGRNMQIPCPGCPVNIKDIQGNVNAVTTQVESALRLSFSVEHAAEQEADRLMLNGVQFYPLDPFSPAMQSLTADQLVKTHEGKFEYAASPNLGYALRISHPVAPSNHKEQLDLVEVHFEIIDVAGKLIDGMSDIVLKVLETPSGKLMIGDAEILPPKATSGPECTTIVCKWRAIVAAKLSKLKGCGSKRPKAGSYVHLKPAHPKGHHNRPHGSHHGGRPHHRHHRHGNFARFLRSVIFHVLIPVLIGVVVGITASLVGMIIGHLAIFVYRAVFRRHSRAEYQKVQQSDAVVDEEKVAFIEHQSPPPVYEDSPAYEVAVGDEKSVQ